jgi:signal recognition particle subunit SRP54
VLFANLSERLQTVFGRLRNRGKLTERDVDEALREIRLALLEADVNYKVVKEFVQRVKERAVGQEVLKSLRPEQQVVKIVHDELIRLMGGEHTKLQLSDTLPSVLMVVGLQGSGKTTTVGKLGNMLKHSGKKVMFCACDIYRPAAIKQLEILGNQLEIPVFSMGNKNDPVNIALAALKQARTDDVDVLIVDTAGRLHIDDELMDELTRLQKVLSPSEVILVVDAMTGQDAVNVAQAFDEKLGLSSLILTKLDSDTRGGAALSIRAVTGKPIKFVGLGEKLDMLEAFHPNRMADRILGMGDILTLIEKAEAAVDKQQAEKMAKKLMGRDEFTLEDFKEQLQQVKRMGSLESLFGMIPGMGNAKALKGLQLDEKQFVKVEAMINSMTVSERRRPDIINGSRKRRIASGSGTTVQDLNKLLKQFKDAKKMLKQFGKLEQEAQKGKLRKGAGLMSFFR